MASTTTTTAPTATPPGKRIGQVLQRLVSLSDHDVDEILHEQHRTRRKFGDIALGWGMVRPEDIWQAWCIQLADRPQRIDLDQFGIDAQAVHLFSGRIARHYNVVPVRVYGDQLVLAGEEHVIQTAAADLRRLLPSDVLFVVADRRAVQRALAKYYPRPADAESHVAVDAA